ncbi:MFS transporter [Desulfosporosinus sp. Sb-LF]|uniref:MFS transporter n=1 Tax=Desulfosporosinus sp. Sb-LF TaxID=2560027 RepID=UPI00107F7FEE|nr:MFS transporter [Desulfosporosinus sp. Sb-LF]TGE32032.1 MFS transporter [Desulfosporosinus sp. Sb-LF]
MKRTNVRYLILGMAMLMYFITFMDRVNISVAAPYISSEYGLNKIQMGAIFSAFTLSYAIFQMPGGWFGDRFGARFILPIFVAWWSVWTALTTLGRGYTSFLLIRFGFGVGEAGAFPVAQSALSRWLRPEERGLSQGLLQSATRIGSAATPPLVAAIIAWGGWRMAFILCAGLGIVWAIGWWIIYRDRPENHPFASKAEIDYILNGKKESIAVPKTPWGRILSSPSVWALCLSYMAFIYVTYIYFNWFPTYLKDARNFPLLKMGFYAALPFLAGAVANTLGGMLSDKLVKKTNGSKWARRIIPLVGSITLAFFMVPGALVQNNVMSVILLSFALASSEFGIGVYWASALDIAGPHAGTVSGLMNTFGNLGGFVSPLVFGYIVQTTGNWATPFLVASVVSVAGALLWLVIDPTKKVYDETQG